MKTRKILSLVLALALVISLGSISAFAGSASPSPSPTPAFTKIAIAKPSDKLLTVDTVITATTTPATAPTGATGVAYTWHRLAAAATAPDASNAISGQTAATYTLTVDDLGKYIVATVKHDGMTAVVKSNALGPVVQTSFAAEAGVTLNMTDENVVISKTDAAAKVTGLTAATPTMKAYLAFTKDKAAADGSVAPTEVKAAQITLDADGNAIINVSKLLEKKGVIEFYVTAADAPKPVKGAKSLTYWVVTDNRKAPASGTKIGIDAAEGKGYGEDGSGSFVFISGPDGMIFREEAGQWASVTGNKLPTYLSPVEYQVRIPATGGNAAVTSNVQAASKIVKIKVAGTQKPTTVKADFVKGTIALKAGMAVSADGNTWTAITATTTTENLEAFGIEVNSGKFTLAQAAYENAVLYVRIAPSLKKPASYPQTIVIPGAGAVPVQGDFALSADGKKVVYLLSKGVLEYLDTSKTPNVWKKGVPKLTVADNVAKLNGAEKVSVRYQATYAAGPSAAFELTAASLKPSSGGAGQVETPSVTINKSEKAATVTLTAVPANLPAGTVTYEWTGGTIESGSDAISCVVSAEGDYTVKVFVGADQKATASITLGADDIGD